MNIITSAAIANNAAFAATAGARSPAAHVQTAGRGLRQGRKTEVHECNLAYSISDDGSVCIPDCDDPDAPPYCIFPEDLDVRYAPQVAPLVTGELRSTSGRMVVDLTNGRIIIRGAGHSLNDGLRDTRWRRADRAVKRWFGSIKERARAASKVAVDEVPLFMAKVLGAGLVVYGVCIALVQYYG